MLVGWWYWGNWCNVGTPGAILISAMVDVSRLACCGLPLSLYLGTFTVERKANLPTPPPF